MEIYNIYIYKLCATFRTVVKLKAFDEDDFDAGSYIPVSNQQKWFVPSRKLKVNQQKWFVLSRKLKVNCNETVYDFDTKKGLHLQTWKKILAHTF